MTAQRTGPALLLPFTFSAIAIVALVMAVDTTALRSLGSRINWGLVPALVVLVAALVAVFGWRWHRLLDGRVSVGAAMTSTALGLGANQVLPARGGDLLRALQVSRSSRISPHFSLSKLVLEKLLDLLAVAALALLALGFALNAGSNAGLRWAGMMSAAVMLIVTLCLLRLAASGRFSLLLHAIARRLRLGPRIYRHLYRGAVYLERAARARALIVPMLITALLWFAVYPFTYYAIATAVDIHISAVDAIILLCAGALGLALPAAPSGIGTFHASIVAGYVLTGHSAGDGLILAIAVHAVFTIGFGAAGIIAAAQASRHYGTANSPGASR